MNLFGFWLIIGFLVHKYYIYKDDFKLLKEFQRGKYSLSAYFIDFFSTLFLWPVTIYNNEVKKK